jgi:glycerol uptake facilitator-like aquaporin
MKYEAVGVEFVGTFIFLFVIAYTGNPWAIGLTLALLAYFLGGISGGHFNPAVTLMFLYKKSITASVAVCYIAVQVLAGLLALEASKKF